MDQPVTANPLVISIINMAVVFAVLYCLSWIIRLIRYIDPTKEKKETASDTVQPEFCPQSIPLAAAAEGYNPELIAVIAAAIAAYGYDQAEIRSITRIDSTNWKHAGRVGNLRSS